MLQNRDTSIDVLDRRDIYKKILSHDFGQGHKMKLFQLFDLQLNPKNKNKTFNKSKKLIKFFNHLL